jgi:4-amino-4-deoxy-L-arabinose transferase-like glycosyltransferase
MKTPDHAAERRILLAILCSAFIIRLALIGPAHSAGLLSDEKEFLFLAQQIRSGNGFVDSNGDRSIRAPLFPALIAPLVDGGTGFPWLPFLLMPLSSVGMVYAGWALSRRLWNDRLIALVAAGILAFFPPLVLYGSLLLSENVFLPLFLLLILLSMRLPGERKLWPFIAIGIIAGIATLTRAALVGVFVALLAGVAYERKRNALQPWTTAVSLLVFVLVILPWGIRNYAIHGEVIPVSDNWGRSLLLGNNPFSHGTTRMDPGFFSWVDEEMHKRGYAQPDSLPEIVRIRAERSIATEYIVAHPIQTVFLSVRKFHVFLMFPLNHRALDRVTQAFLMGIDILLWGVIILSIPVIRKHGVALFQIVGLMGLFALMHLALHAEARYRLPIVPLLCILGAGSIRWLDSEQRRVMWSDRGTRRVVIGGLAVVVLAYAMTGVLYLRGEV